MLILVGTSMNFNNTPPTQKTPIDVLGGQTGNRLAEGGQGNLVPPTDNLTRNEPETLLMELNSPSSDISDAESVVTISGHKPKDKRKRVDLSSSSPDCEKSPPNKKGAPEKAPTKDTNSIRSRKKGEKDAPSSKTNKNDRGEAMDRMASQIDELEKYLISKKGGRITVQMMEHLSLKFSETREALDSLKRTFIDEVRQAVAVDISDLVDKAIAKKLSERSRTPLANRPGARAIQPASLTKQPPAARPPAVDVATAGPSSAWQTVTGRRKTMSQVLRDAPDPPPQPPVSNAPKTPKRRKRLRKKKSNKPFSPRVGILIQPKEGETVEAFKDKITKVADPSKMGIGVQKVIRSREGLRIEVVKTDTTKDKLEVLGRELENHGYITKSLEEHRLPRVAILGADPATAAEDVLLAVSSQLSVPTGEICCHHNYKTREGSITWVLEVSPSVRLTMLARKRIFLGWRCCRVSDHLRITLCYKCLAYGHMAKDCTNAELCSHCAGKHSKTQCPNMSKPPICGVCGPGKKASHHPGSNKCPTHLRKLEMFRKTIHYGNA
ncbi:hypothetical protein M8J76_017343 [Diaphorina citri]|nr:hypothetical protein M8J76_017343 [Diaphorina citri]KAI5756234.1 hypothetical protein M8J77_023240 [Diaphorina citri]